MAAFSAPCGFTVAAIWLLLGLSGRWRPEKSWIDRLGRLLGVVWIACRDRGICTVVIGLVPEDQPDGEQPSDCAGAVQPKTDMCHEPRSTQR